MATEKVSVKKQLGGKRPGAGRKKGIPNRRTVELQEKIASEGITPLDFMLQTMRDEKQPHPVRMAAAAAAAPYVHAKLSSVEVGGPGGGPVTVEIIRFGKTAAA